jgi:transcriptional regulator with XRE-family HTH domain
MGRKPPKIGRPRSGNNALGRWIDRHGWTRDRVAARLGVSRRYLDRLCNGDRRPNLELAVRIEDLTGGEVSVRYWLRTTTPHSGE